MAAQKKKRRRNRHDPNRAQAAAQREEAKRRLREERRKAALAAEKKERRMAVLKRWSRYVLVGAGVTVGALLIFRPTPEVEGVEVRPEIRAVAILPGATGSYGTDTPTSGPYYEDGQACGVFDEEISPEQAATDIYYGAVVLWHGPDLDDAGLAELLAAAGRYDDRVVVSPQDGLTSPIVATAWNRLKEYDSAAGVDEFIETYRGRAPGDGDCRIDA
jgi:hypothetical protein